MPPDFDKWDNNDWNKALSLGLISAAVYAEHKRKQQNEQHFQKRMDQYRKQELEERIAGLESELRASQPAEVPTWEEMRNRENQRRRSEAKELLKDELELYRILSEFSNLLIAGTNPDLIEEQRIQARKEAIQIVSKERERGDKFDFELSRNALRDIEKELTERPLREVHEEIRAQVQKAIDDGSLPLQEIEQALDRMNEEDIQAALERKSNYEKVFRDRQKAQHQQQKTERLQELRDKSLLTKISEVELTWVVLIVDALLLLIWWGSGFAFFIIMVLAMGFLWLPWLHFKWIVGILEHIAILDRQMKELQQDIDA